jgi:hypothetical protein
MHLGSRRSTIAVSISRLRSRPAEATQPTRRGARSLAIATGDSLAGPIMVPWRASRPQVRLACRRFFWRRRFAGSGHAAQCRPPSDRHCPDVAKNQRCRIGRWCSASLGVDAASKSCKIMWVFYLKIYIIPKICLYQPGKARSSSIPIASWRAMTPKNRLPFLKHADLLSFISMIFISDTLFKVKMATYSRV